MFKKFNLAFLGAPILAFAVAGCSGEAALGDAEQAQAEKAEKTESTASSARPAAAAAPRPAPVCQECGTVSAVEPIQVKGQGSGAGAVTGAVIGGVVGNQIGGGSGRRIATVIGAVGGGYAGHKTEEHIRSSEIYRVTVRMDNGGTRTMDVDDATYLRVGQKVAIHGNDIALR